MEINFGVPIQASQKHFRGEMGNTTGVSDRAEVQAQIVHIVYADVVGYSRLSLESKNEIDQVLQAGVAAETGTGGVLTTVDNGDGFFLAFGGDPQRAAEAAVNLHERFGRELTVKVRIGVHSGVAFLREDLRGGVNLTGPAVERAQRTMSAATGDCPLVSEEMYSILKEFEAWRHLLSAPTLVRTKGQELVAVWRLGKTDNEFDILVTLSHQVDDVRAMGFKPMAGVQPETLEELGLLARVSHSYRLGCLCDGFNGWAKVRKGETACTFEELSDVLESLREELERSENRGEGKWVERDADRTLREAIARNASFVLVRSARFTGKTTLLIAGKAYAESLGYKTVFHDFRAEGAGVINDLERCYRSIAQTFFRQLGFPGETADQIWNEDLGANSNLERCVEHALENIEGNIFWAWDEAERLLHQPYADDLFGLLRSWHNRRAWEANSQWSRLTIAFTYRVDAGAVIRNQQQSPFNVGIDVVLRDFSRGELAALSRTYGDVMVQGSELDTFLAETGGHPMLASAVCELLVSGNFSLSDLTAFKIPATSRLQSHLDDLWRLVSADDSLRDACRLALANRAHEARQMTGLLDLGILKETVPGEYDFRAGLYRRAFSVLLR